MAPIEINLTRGAPPVEVFPINDLIRCSEVSLREFGHTTLQYSRSPGFTPLIEWIGEAHHVSIDQVFVANSSLEILSFYTQIFLKPGDRVFVELPAYDRTITMLKRAGIEIVGIPLEDDGINLDYFESEIKHGKPVFFYIVADFQNPMGITTCEDKRKRILALAEQYDFFIFEDSPYRALRYIGKELHTFFSRSSNRVLYVNSFSKTLAPGLRIGYMIGPEEMIKKLTRWAEDSYIGPVTISQGLVYEYCRQGLLQQNIQKLITLYRPKLLTALELLDKHLPEAHYPRPEGGYYIGVTLPPGNLMQNLLPRASTVGLKLTDGRGFFLNPEDGNRFLRIPFCSLSLSEIDEAIIRLTKILS